uniref:Uncharacterized protein n=1 Tax=Molossus molossus TaxID=27622 RepID=A0A7J8CS62_MOLMO|nr:hypothetical protein HJG59_009783 [Molossus molossus]
MPPKSWRWVAVGGRQPAPRCELELSPHGISGSARAGTLGSCHCCVSAVAMLEGQPLTSTRSMQGHLQPLGGCSQPGDTSANDPKTSRFPEAFALETSQLFVIRDSRLASGKGLYSMRPHRKLPSEPDSGSRKLRSHCSPPFQIAAEA